MHSGDSVTGNKNDVLHDECMQGLNHIAEVAGTRYGCELQQLIACLQLTGNTNYVILSRQRW